MWKVITVQVSKVFDRVLRWYFMFTHCHRTTECVAASVAFDFCVAKFMVFQPHAGHILGEDFKNKSLLYEIKIYLILEFVL